MSPCSRFDASDEAQRDEALLVSISVAVLALSLSEGTLSAIAVLVSLGSVV